MKFGLNDQEYQFLLVNVVRPLEQQGAKVYCYGSRARGTHRPFSDVDLMVEGGENVSGRVGEISEFC
jgi:predicted nucleotidyltransferase